MQYSDHLLLGRSSELQKLTTPSAGGKLYFCCLGSTRAAVQKSSWPPATASHCMLLRNYFMSLPAAFSVSSSWEELLLVPFPLLVSDFPQLMQARSCDRNKDRPVVPAFSSTQGSQPFHLPSLLPPHTRKASLTWGQQPGPCSAPGQPQRSPE